MSTKCDECSSLTFRLSYNEYFTEYFHCYLKCTCENSDTKIAAEREYHNNVTDSVTEFGHFDEEGYWEIDDEERDIKKSDNEEDSFHVHCLRCLEVANESCWETKKLNPEDWGEIPELEEISFKCVGCGMQLPVTVNDICIDDLTAQKQH